MSNLKADSAVHEGTFVIEFSVTPERAHAMILEDDPRAVVPLSKMDFLPKFRVIVQGLGSIVDVFHRYLDFVGNPAWARLSEGVTFNDSVTIYRRQVVVEAFRRLVAGGGRRHQAPTGALVINFD